MPRSILLAVSFLLTVASFAQELPLTGVQYGPAPFQRVSPQMASDGTNFLVAWRDGRGANGYEPIVAARVSADGRLLDEPTAIAIPDAHDRAPSSSTNSPPAVVWTGSVWVVAWDDLELRAVQFVRVERDGRVLDTRPRSIDGGGLLWGGSASSGDRSLILSSVTGFSPAMYATLLDASGEVVIERIPISNRETDFAAVVASNGSGFLVAWLRWNGTNHTLVVAPVSRTGVVGAAREVALSRAMPVIASSGGDYLVGYTTNSKNIVMERFDAEGHTLAQTMLSFQIPELFMAAALTPYGSGYLLAYTLLDRTLHGLVLDRNGSFVEQRQLNASGHAEGPVALATNGSSTMMAWPEADQPFADPTRMYARVLETQNAPALLSRSAPVQSRVHAATNGNGYLAAFLNWPAGGDLRVARTTANGASLDVAGTLIDDEYVSERPAVAFDGRNYVVAWTRRIGTELRVNRVTAEGSLLDGVGGRVVAPSAQAFGLGSNGSQSLLVWSTADQPGGSSSIRAQRMEQDGTLDALMISIPSRDHLASQFSVTWAHGTWLVAWRETIVTNEWWQFPTYHHNVLAARVSEGGTVLDGVPIVIAESPLADTAPVVATNGKEFLVAWRELQQGSRSAILARRVGFDGIAGAVMNVAEGQGDGRYTSTEALGLVAVGGSYRIAWEDAGDLFQSVVGSGIRVPLAASSDDERNVMLLPTPAGFVAFYERVATERLYGGVSRAFLRFGANVPRTRVVRR
jgi:hypothetical protein